MQPGQTYQYEVTVAVKSGTGCDPIVSSASVFVTTSTVPLGGTCTVFPKTGVAFATEFTLSCEGWTATDGSDSSSLLYAFAYRGSIFDQPMPLSLKQTTPSLKTLLYSHQNDRTDDYFNVTFSIYNSLSTATAATVAVEIRLYAPRTCAATRVGISVMQGQLTRAVAVGDAFATAQYVSQLLLFFRNARYTCFELLTVSIDLQELLENACLSLLAPSLTAGSWSPELALLVAETTKSMSVESKNLFARKVASRALDFLSPATVKLAIVMLSLVRTVRCDADALTIATSIYSSIRRREFPGEFGSFGEERLSIVLSSNPKLDGTGFDLIRIENCSDVIHFNQMRRVAPRGDIFINNRNFSCSFSSSGAGNIGQSYPCASICQAALSTPNQARNFSRLFQQECSSVVNESLRWTDFYSSSAATTSSTSSSWKEYWPFLALALLVCGLALQFSRLLLLPMSEWGVVTAHVCISLLVLIFGGQELKIWASPFYSLFTLFPFVWIAWLRASPNWQFKRNKLFLFATAAMMTVLAVDGYDWFYARLFFSKQAASVASGVLGLLAYVVFLVDAFMQSRLAATAAEHTFQVALGHSSSGLHYRHAFFSFHRRLRLFPVFLAVVLVLQVAFVLFAQLYDVFSIGTLVCCLWLHWASISDAFHQRNRSKPVKFSLFSKQGQLVTTSKAVAGTVCATEVVLDCTDMDSGLREQLPCMALQSCGDRKPTVLRALRINGKASRSKNNIAEEKKKRKEVEKDEKNAAAYKKSEDKRLAEGRGGFSTMELWAPVRLLQVLRYREVVDSSVSSSSSPSLGVKTQDRDAALNEQMDSPVLGLSEETRENDEGAGAGGWADWESSMVEAVRGNQGRDCVQSVWLYPLLMDLSHISRLCAAVHGSCLKTLWLQDMPLPLPAIKQIAQLLASPSSCLTILSLSRTGLDSEGAQLLASALSHNGVLQALDLSGNAVGDAGATAFVEVLELNATLTELNLTDNSIGSQGAIALAGAVMQNSWLTVLRLRHNDMQDEGAKAFAAALAVNKTLLIVELKHNNVKALGQSLLAQALSNNHSLLAQVKVMSLGLSKVQQTRLQVKVWQLKLGPYIAALSLFFQLLQFLSFPFSMQVDLAWSEEAGGGWTRIVLPALQLDTGNFFEARFWSMIFVMAVALSFVLPLSLPCFRSKEGEGAVRSVVQYVEGTGSRFILVVIVVASVASSMLYLPVARTVFTTFDCSFNACRALTMDAFEDGSVLCYQGAHLLKVFLGILFFLPYVVLCIRLARVSGNITQLYADANSPFRWLPPWTDDTNTAATDGNAMRHLLSKRSIVLDMVVLVTKTVLCAASIIFTFYPIVFTALLVIFTLAILVAIVKHAPFYNARCNWLLLAAYSAIFYTNVISFFVAVAAKDLTPPFSWKKGLRIPVSTAHLLYGATMALWIGFIPAICIGGVVAARLLPRYSPSWGQQRMRNHSLSYNKVGDGLVTTYGRGSTSGSVSRSSRSSVELEVVDETGESKPQPSSPRAEEIEETEEREEREGHAEILSSVSAGAGTAGLLRRTLRALRSSVIERGGWSQQREKLRQYQQTPTTSRSEGFAANTAGGHTKARSAENLESVVSIGTSKKQPSKRATRIGARWRGKKFSTSSSFTGQAILEHGEEGNAGNGSDANDTEDLKEELELTASSTFSLRSSAASSSHGQGQDEGDEEGNEKYQQFCKESSASLERWQRFSAGEGGGELSTGPVLSQTSSVASSREHSRVNSSVVNAERSVCEEKDDVRSRDRDAK